MNRWLLARALITALSFVSVNAAMSVSPGQAFYNWYLYYSPVMIAALSFGLVGAGVSSLWAGLSLWVNFTNAADPAQVAGIVQTPVMLTEEASRWLGGLSARLFVQSSDGTLLGAASYQVLLGNALLGGILTTAASCLIGWLVDENRRQTVRFRILAQRDGLTGVANYRHLMERLQQEFVRSQRSALPFAYLMVDLDGLKGLNDRQGHAAGDAVLRDIAQKLQANVRAVDVVGRYGGDEFGLLLVNTGIEEAVATAQRLRESVAEARLGGGAGQPGVTISVGVAAYPDHGDSPDKLVHAADDALYQTKMAGKNGVTLARSAA